MLSGVNGKNVPYIRDGSEGEFSDDNAFESVGQLQVINTRDTIPKNLVANFICASCRIIGRVNQHVECCFCFFTIICGNLQL